MEMVKMENMPKWESDQNGKLPIGKMEKLLNGKMAKMEYGQMENGQHGNWPKWK